MSALLYIVIPSMTLYVCAGSLWAYQLMRKTDRFTSVTKAIFFAALLLQSIGIGISSVSTSGTLLQGPNILMLASWMLAVVFIFFEIGSRRPYGYGVFITPIVILMMFVALVMLNADQTAGISNRVYDGWPVLVLHIALFLVAIACFLISGVASGMLLYQQHLARIRSDRFLTIRMPALSTLKKIAGRSVIIGLPLLTAAVFIGLMHLFSEWSVMSVIGDQDGLLYLIPRIVIALIALVIYCIYIFVIYLKPGSMRSKTISWLSIIGALVSLTLPFLSSTAVL